MSGHPYRPRPPEPPPPPWTFRASCWLARQEYPITLFVTVFWFAVSFWMMWEYGVDTPPVWCAFLVASFHVDWAQKARRNR